MWQYDRHSAIFNHYLYPKNGDPQPDIFTFQETHLINNDEPHVKACLGGQILFSHGSCSAKGVTLGFNPKLDVQIIDSARDSEGRFVIVNAVIQQQQMTIVNAYLDPALTTTQYLEVLSQITVVVERFEKSRVVYCGDFNTIINAGLDSNTKWPNKTRAKALIGFMDSQDLTDVWRVQHPNTKRFTSFTNVTSLSCLDFFLVSPTMLTHVQDSSIGTLYLTDHSPIYMEFSLEDIDHGKGVFRVPNFLLGDRDYKKNMVTLIGDLKDNNPEASQQALWDTVQASVRGETIRYLSQLKRAKKQQIEGLEAEIFEATLARDQNADNPDLVIHYASKVKFLQIELDNVYTAQNAQAKKYNAMRKYYQTGRSTKYYFRKPGRRHDAIKCLITPQGYMVTDTQGILDECVRFYSDVYKQSPETLENTDLLQEQFLRYIPKGRIHEVHYSDLDKPITQAELFNALSSMKMEKSPGESGLTVEFYRTFWPEISSLIHGAITEALSMRELTFSQRRGLLRLVPKKNKDPLRVSSWRPITLLNVDYNLLSKTLALRLRKALPDLVHADQKGFIQGRYIGDNVLDVCSIIAAAEEQEEEAILLMLDIQAAFDSVSWSFLSTVLDAYNFPPSFIQWIRILYRKKEISIINAGHVSKPIKPTNGLAQGDWLSPLLFVLIIETLALSIHNNAMIQGLRCADTQKKLALLVDDAILALKHDEITFKTLLETLQHFATVSNLMSIRKNQ